MKIAVVDDHPSVLAGIVHYLKEFLPKHLVIKGFLSGKEFEEFIKHETVGIVVMDIELEDSNGLDLLGKMNLKMPEMKVIIHTGSMHFNKLIHAIKYGAKGYITKSESLNEVLEAILNAIQGGPFYAKKMEKIYRVQLEKFYKDNSIDCIYDLLTEHEKNILTEYSSGNVRKKIADKLGLKAGTFNVHISNIMKKLNVTTEAGLIKFCLENNFHH